MHDAKDTRDAITKGMQMTLLAGFLGWMMDGYEQALFPTLAKPALESMVPAGAVVDTRIAFRPQLYGRYPQYIPTPMRWACHRLWPAARRCAKARRHCIELGNQCCT